MPRPVIVLRVFTENQVNLVMSHSPFELNEYILDASVNEFEQLRDRVGNAHIHYFNQQFQTTVDTLRDHD